MRGHLEKHKLLSLLSTALIAGKGGTTCTQMYRAAEGCSSGIHLKLLDREHHDATGPGRRGLLDDRSRVLPVQKGGRVVDDGLSIKKVQTRSEEAAGQRRCVNSLTSI